MSPESASSGAFAEIDLDALCWNARCLKALTPEKTRFMAVVKADGYGHGAAEAARAAASAGADFLAVARPEEAWDLLEAGIPDIPLLVFGRCPADMAAGLASRGVRLTVSRLSEARELREALDADRARAGRDLSLRVHVKVDTGMGRMGIPAHGSPGALTRAAAEIAAISRLPGVEREGLYSHFAAADERDKTHAHLQISRFRELLSALDAAGIDPGIRHMCNSAGIMELPEAHFDMVRAGISLYGLYPSDEVDRSRVALKPVMCLKTRLVKVLPAPAGTCVSYGMTWKSPQDTLVGVAALGYADGYPRLLSNTGEMLVRGVRAPIAGRVCMDLVMLDLGHIPDAAEGDEVIAFGRDAASGREISADELARKIGTINYEIVSALTRRPPRCYRRGPDNAGAVSTGPARTDSGRRASVFQP
ncbi:MAG: alanine racemase [Desulfobacterales bacterium]|nr:MAG: alanine racemase [Desulfobacterales bacterium]